MNSIWELTSFDEETAQNISQALGISALSARLVVQRGISKPEEASAFLHPDLAQLIDPLMMQGMKAGVERIMQAVNQKEKVIIYGDYDVDGVCSVVLLKECLDRIGLVADYYVPNRFNEGYGLNREAVEELAGKGYKLIITVDCGISSVIEAELAMSLGVDLIITDHHTPPLVQPQAVAVINPKNDQILAVTHLAGVGVAYKLATALLKANGFEIGMDYLDLVALATVADIVPLLEENRILVKYGLEVLEKTQRPGLQALMQMTALTGKKLETWHIGYVLAPRLNSAGRLDSARKSIELLLSRDRADADTIAAQLCKWNDERKRIEDSIYQQARLDIEGLEGYDDLPVMIAAGEGWHEGVIGIVASRLVNHYNRPAIVISWDGDQGRGSARSTGNLDLYAALQHCQDNLEQFGGHKMAAGLSIRKEKLNDFQQAIGAYINDFGRAEGYQKRYRVDLEVDDTEIDRNLLQEIAMLSPYGEGNPFPCFALRASTINEPVLVGGGAEHLKCKTNNNLEAIAFNRPDLFGPWLQNCKQDLLFELNENTFRGRSSLQLKIKDMKSSFYPDVMNNIKQNPAGMRESIQQTVDELALAHPVLFVYPSYRSMSKHVGLLQGIFRPEQVQALHGLLTGELRKLIEKQFERGESRLFTTTQAYLQYYCSKHLLPSSLRYVLFLWPDQDDLSGMMKERNIPTGKINTNASRFSMCQAGEETYRQGRCVVYANRPSTILNYKKNAEVEIESGISDFRQRKLARQRFSRSMGGTLLIDGNHPHNLDPIGKIEHFVLADSPFGFYELAAVADYTDEVEIPLSIAFQPDDLMKNRNYLERIYPEGKLVQDAALQLRKTGTVFKGTEEQLASRLAADLKRDFRQLDLLPILHIMADLGLCQFQKSGSIIETKFLKTDITDLNMAGSPYYLEGQEEKRLFIEWERSVNNNLVW